MEGLRTVVLLTGGLAFVVLLCLWAGLAGPEGVQGEEKAGSVAAPEPEEPAAEPLPEAPPAEPAGHGRGTITGRVVHFKSGDPAPDVVVKLAAGPGGFGGRQEVTGEDGWFTFRELPAGSGYLIVVEHGEFATIRKPDLIVANDEITDVGTLFLEQAVEFLVRVVDGADRPLGGAAVSVFSTPSPSARYDSNSWVEAVIKAAQLPTAVATATAEANGEAKITDLPAGYYVVSAAAEGYARAGVSRLLSPDNVAEPVVIRLGRGFELAGLVTDADGKPVAGRVLVIPGGANAGVASLAYLRMASETDEEGKFGFTGLPSGPASLMMEIEGRPAFPVGRVAVPELEFFHIRLGEAAVVEGTVKDPEGRPVAGAEIRAMVNAGGAYSGATVVSGEEGAYRLEGLPPGYLYRLDVLAEGFARYPPPGVFREQMYLTPGTVARVDVKLGKGVALTGKVTLERGGTPLGGARVTLIARSAWLSYSETTTAARDGTYRFDDVSPGEYAIQVSAEGAFQKDYPRNSWRVRQPQYKLDDRWKVRIEEGEEETQKDLELTEGGTISGRVEDSQGKPVAGARITITGVTSSKPQLSGPEGTFSVGGVPEGDKIYVYARLGRRYARAPPVSLGPGGRAEGLRLTLKAVAVVSGVVETADGGPVAGGVVKAVSGDARRNRWLVRRSGPSTPVGEDGSFRIEEVYPGQVTVVAHVPGYPPGISDVLTVPDGTDVPGVRVRLERGQGISGLVRLRSGEPVAQAEISVSGNTGVVGSQGPYGSGGGRVTLAQSDEEGRFSIQGLEPGKYHLQARKDGLVTAVKSNVDPSTGETVTLEMQEGGEIRGKVLDERRNPVAGIRVSLSVKGRNSGGLPQATTGADGTFLLRGVKEGEYTVIAAPGWGSELNLASGTKENVRPGDPEVVIHVEPGYKVSGEVMDPEGQPASGLVVRAYGRDSRGKNVNKYVQTRHDGRFELPGLPVGNYSVTVQARGGGLASLTLKDVAAGTQGLTIVLQRALSIEGYVVDPDGVPVPHVQIQAKPMPGEGGSNGWGRSDGNGRFSLRNLSPAAYQVTFTASGRFIAQTVDDVPAGTGGLMVTMDPGKTIEGVAVDEYGEPLPGTAVTAKPADGKGATVSGGTDREGKFKIAGLPSEKKYKLTAQQRKGGYVLSDPLEVESGAKKVKLELTQGLSIQGQVLDSDGRGIAGAYISIQSGGRGWAQTDASGTFRINGLEPGELRLQVWASGIGNKQVTVRAGNLSLLIRFE